MPVYNETRDDFNLKWYSTYARYNNEVVFIHGAHYRDEKSEENQEPNWYVLFEKQGKRLEISNEDMGNLQPLMFDSQFFNYFDPSGDAVKALTPACLYFTRLPRRQNKRSVCQENVSITNPLHPWISALRSRWPGHYALTGKFIDCLLEHTFPTYADALGLCSKYLIVALSPGFAVGLSPISPDKFILASPFGMIGEADATTLYIHHPGSYQEVSDLVNRRNLNVRVINARD